MSYRERQKISQMTPKGSNLSSTDLVEVSVLESGSYVTKSVTGQQIINSASGGSFVPYVGATQDVDLDTNKISARSVYIEGTNGGGHLHLKHQAIDANATGQSTALYANGDGDLKWKNDNQYYTTLKTSLNTDNRVYTFPNATCELQQEVVLTTNGETGAATFDGVTLNIPNYIPTNAIHRSASEIFRGFFFNNNSTTVTTEGGLTASATGSTLAQSVASTNFATKQIRLRYYGSVASTGRYSGLRGSALLWFIGGGFKFVCDVNISDTAFSSNCQQFYGLAGQTTDLNYGGATQTLVRTNFNLIGVGSDNGDANLQVFHNDNSGNDATKIDLGAAFPANRTAGAAMTTVYSILLYNAPNTTSVIYNVINNETGAIARGTITTDLPAHTQGLNVFASRAMGSPVTNTGQFDLMKLGCFSLL
jgi:hypothetical protein